MCVCVLLDVYAVRICDGIGAPLDGAVCLLDVQHGMTTLSHTRIHTHPYCEKTTRKHRTYTCVCEDDAL